MKNMEVSDSSSGEKYINTQFLSKLKTTDSKLIYYLIYRRNQFLKISENF